MTLPPSSADSSSNNSHPAASAPSGSRSTRPASAAWPSAGARQPSRRGVTPISTTAASDYRPGSSSESPSRATFASPTALSFNAAAAGVNRQVSSRQSSTSSSNSFAAPSGAGHAGSRSRAVTSASSPRLASSLASLSLAAQGSSSDRGGTRLVRHSPSVSLSATGSPTSSNAPNNQLTSLVITQLNILLSTIKENNYDAQAEKIRSLIDDNGMELFAHYFRRLLQSNASAIFPASARPSTANETSGQYKLLTDEMNKVSRDARQAENIAQALETTEGDLFRDFDLSTFVDHFRLNAIAKVALVLPIRTSAKADLRSKADAILTNSFQAFLQALAAPSDGAEDVSAEVLAALIERLIHDPPRSWSDEQRENLFMAIGVRYKWLNTRIPSPIESVMFLFNLFESSDSRLARLVHRAGPRATESVEACKEMLAGVETRDISYPQIANALLLMVCTQSVEPYDPTVFVEALLQHRAGKNVDWTDVVQGFDKPQLRITKSQFLALYNALLPLAKTYANFDIQGLWSGQWENFETQLHFIVAFLHTQPHELDVTQIPNLRQAFSADDFAQCSDHIKDYAAEAVKHPLSQRDAAEGLFNMIFRSQETYNIAQALRIPEDIINANMTIFICAVASVPKPWVALQDQAMKQLFYPFLLRQHPHYDFVMYAMWQADKQWVAQRIFEYYQQDQMSIGLAFEHAYQQGWLETLLTIQNTFAVDLVTYGHGRGACNLEDWAQPHLNSMGGPSFARAIKDFLGLKLDDETLVQREREAPKTAPLAVKTVHLLLLLLIDALPDEEVGQFIRQCLTVYPRLFNYGDDEARDAILDQLGEHGNGLPEDCIAHMDETYKSMYGGNVSPDDVVKDLQRLKSSDDPHDLDLFCAMLHGLFDEYNCFGEYPNEALATTAVLFGGLVQFRIMSDVAEHAATSMIFEAVSECGPEDQMYRFGLQAMIHLLGRLKEWPHLAEKILHTPSLQGTQVIDAAQNAIRELQQENATTNGDGVNGIANGALDEELLADAPNPQFSAVQVDPPLRPDLYEDPNEDVSDKVMFVLNNVSKRNLEEKFKDLESALEDKHHQWFAHYLVDELAKSQPNFQSLYLQLLESFDKKILWQEVLRETYASCAKMLNAESTLTSAPERNNLKNLADWLGSLTLARNQPILHRNMSFKDLLFEAQDTQRLIVAIPFTCTALKHARDSKIFKPPNPWLMELLGMLSELYHNFDLKLNLKFAIEVLCKDLRLDIKDIEPLDTIANRRMIQDNNLLQQYVVDGGADGFSDVHIMGLSKRAPNERFSPEAVIQAIPDLGGLLQIPTAAGNVTQPQLRTIFVNAAQQAIYEIIAPVVERSVTIAAISAAELISKDFASEPDVDKLRASAHTVVKSLSGSLALVTCKEPLRMSIMNNIRILAARTLPDQLPEGQIIMFVNDNIDTVCGLVERAAEEHSKAEIDAQLADIVETRRRHMAERPNEPFNNPPVSRWAQLIPEPYKQEANGLNRQQLALYEDFGRQARIAPTQHTNNQSQDRQIPDVLSDSYLPSIPTPADVPAMPRQTPQQRIQAAQNQMNGYPDGQDLGNRIVILLHELQQAARDAAEEHINDVGEESPIRRIFAQIIGTIDNAGVQRDALAMGAGNKCLYNVFDTTLKRLETEVLVRLIKTLCEMSVNAGRQLTIQLATVEGENVFNADVIASLLHEDLLDPQHIDAMVSRAVKLRRPISLTFLGDFVDEVFLREKPLALRSDFVLTYEALCQWLADEPGLERGREIVTKLSNTQASGPNGVPSPPQTDKQDQMEYLFEEWLVLQRRRTSERSSFAFVKQLEEHVVHDPNETVAFFRACLEMSLSDFNRKAGQPWSSADEPYVQIDGLAKLFACMVVYQTPVDGETKSKAKVLDAIMRLTILVMNAHHNTEREHWNGRVYFRLFSSLLCELQDARVHLTANDQFELAQVFATSLMVLQPKYFSGFTYSWLALVGHRLFVPKLLDSNVDLRAGWDSYVRLLVTLFISLGELLSAQDAPAMQDFYRGVTRLMVLLHHDFPQFLLENHVQLNSSIPPVCVQLHNLVNSAVPRGLIAGQPDPFTPGLKVNRIELIRTVPNVTADVDKVVTNSGIKDLLLRCSTGSMSSNEIDNAELEVLYSAIEAADKAGPPQQLLLNSMVVYLGGNTTQTSSSFSAAAPTAHLLVRLLKELHPESRYHLVCAILNQVRYVNAHTHYFSGALQHFFTSGDEGVQQTIMRAIVERLGVPRPHPWGLIVMVLELVKNPGVNIFELPWVRGAPQVESLLGNLMGGSERASGLSRSSGSSTIMG